MPPFDATTASENSSTPDEDASNDLGSYLADGADDDAADLLDDAVDIGARLREARDAAGVSRVQLADQLGVRESTITKWESGQTSPRGHRVSKLAGMLGVSISWVLMGHGAEPIGQVDDVEQIRAELNSVRARLEDAVNELAVLEQRLSSVNDV